MGTSSAAAMPERAYMQLEPAACMAQYNCAREHTSSRQVSFNGRISEDIRERSKSPAGPKSIDPCHWARGENPYRVSASDSKPLPVRDWAYGMYIRHNYRGEKHSRGRG